MKARYLRGLLAVMAMALPLAAMAQQAGSGAVSLAGPGAGASEDFDTLASAHNTTSSLLPAGWYFLETGNSSANNTYLVDDGSSRSGNTFSYGSEGSSERALGALGSGSVTTTLGAQLRNDSGATVNEMAISFYVEQWRLGTLNGVDRLTFAYSTDATALDAGTWSTVPALDAISPVTAGTAEQKLDGNLAANRAAVSGTLSGLNLAPNAILWVRWTDVNDPDVDDALAIDDVVFGSPVDVPPTLASSTPAHNATDFPVNAALSLTFSEPVDVSGVWFEIQCASSGYRNPSNVLVSGGPTQYFLTPAAVFTVGEACELTLDTDFITDQGPSAFPLVDPGTIHFTTIAPPPNVLPTVVGTVPTHNASNFPSAGDLKVTFSEPVVADAGAFSLACAASTGIVLTPTTSDGGVNFSIDTGTALVAGDACSFTIHAAAIMDLDGGAMAADVIIDFTVLDIGNVGAYYENVNLASPQMLRCSLHETIKGHTKYPYSGGTTNTWTILEVAQEDPANSNRIIDVYRNRSYAKGSDRAGTGSGLTYNREHSWPNSLGFGNSGLAAYTDTHMLWLSDTDQNSARGNMPYANCPASSGCLELGTEINGGVGGPGQSNWYKGPNGNTGSFQTWNHRKGEMARAMFYMAIRYEGIASEDSHDGDTPDLELTDNRSQIVITSNTAAKAYMGLLSDLLAWHADDLPDVEEVIRNGVIQSFQNNRNPFVDHPEWVTPALFASTQPATCTLNLNAPAANDDSYAVAQGGTLSVAVASGVLVNDSDAEGAPLSAQVATAPSHGSLALVANGGFTYTPQASFCGSDSFSYRASDGTRVSTPATVTVAVGSGCAGGFTVTATSGGNGTITPASQTVTSGGTASFTVTPATGYHVVSVAGDTCTVTGSGASYSAANIQADCAVTATFAIIPPDAIFADGFEN